ncbi:hypothetical protein M569_03382 [Genlisea aurea]|uniref:Cyclin-dependent kinase inhibitor domain-containing protein n=1 Tax=Genlisea aurea TaxID=192259 RepID=S8CVI9_9LAMI|nr:hypothetical protein M569_03382 [Genlisea aurea]
MEEEARTTFKAEGRRKRLSGKDESESSTLFFQVKKPRSGAENSVASSESCTCEIADPYYVCSSNGTGALGEESFDFVDLEENKQVVIGELLGSDAVDFGARENAARTQGGTEMPGADELEAFFSAAEKQLQIQFIKHYNYDIVNDKPLEGRFDWVEVEIPP